MNKLSNISKKPKNSESALDPIPNSRLPAVPRKNLTGSSGTDLLYSEAENNNVQTPKCKIISSFMITNNKDKVPKQNEQCVAEKIETNEHRLELENIQAVESTQTGNSFDNCVKEMGGTPSSENKKKQLNSDESFAKRKRRKYTDAKITEGLENSEKLFIRLVKLDITAKLNELSNGQSAAPSTSLCQAEKPQPLLKPKLLEKPIKKVSKTELHRQNLQNINKTESLKMEQLLLKKFKMAKERQATEDSSKEASDSSTNEIEPYVFEKTNKSVFETYQRTENENGQVVLRCLLCPFSTERFKQMSLHFKFKHRDTPIEEMYFCNVKGCDFKAVHKGIYMWHMRRHMLAADKLVFDFYPCNQCNKVFDQRKGYLIHLKHMHKDPVLLPKKTVFPCATCKFTTTTKQNLQAHIYRSHVPNNIKPTYKCNICGYDTHYKDSLRKHLTRVHLQNK